MTDGFFINLHKALVIPLVLGLMWWFANVTVEMCLYLAMHGTYAMLWLMKQNWYPDRRFDVRRPVWIGIVFVFLPLAGYYVAPYLVASRHVALPAPAIAALVSVYTLGIFFHYVSDAQKFFMLRAGSALITDGLFARTRNPNYFGEILIYLAFAGLSAHWLPFVIVAAWSALFFIPGVREKDKSLARNPEYAAYRARTGALFPRFWLGRPGRLCQRDHSGPELLLFRARLDLVFAREGELAVAADAVHDDGGGKRGDVHAFADRHRPDRSGDEDPRRWIDPEGAQVIGVSVSVLDQRRLAAALIDGKDRDRVLAARKHLLALELAQPPGAVGEIDKAPVGTDVDRTRRLPQF